MCFFFHLHVRHLDQSAPPKDEKQKARRKWLNYIQPKKQFEIYIVTRFQGERHAFPLTRDPIDEPDDHLHRHLYQARPTAKFAAAAKITQHGHTQLNNDLQWRQLSKIQNREQCFYHTQKLIFCGSEWRRGIRIGALESNETGDNDAGQIRGVPDDPDDDAEEGEDKGEEGEGQDDEETQRPARDSCLLLLRLLLLILPCPIPSTPVHSLPLPSILSHSGVDGLVATSYFCRPASCLARQRQVFEGKLI